MKPGSVIHAAGERWKNVSSADSNSRQAWIRELGIHSNSLDVSKIWCYARRVKVEGIPTLCQSAVLHSHRKREFRPRRHCAGLRHATDCARAEPRPTQPLRRGSAAKVRIPTAAGHPRRLTGPMSNPTRADVGRIIPIRFQAESNSLVCAGWAGRPLQSREPRCRSPRVATHGYSGFNPPG